MQFQIKRIDKSLPMPEYQTSGAVAFDLYSRVDLDIPAKSIVYIPLNVIVKVPQGYFLLVAPRSSTHKKGLMMGNNLGIIDQDFCGEADEIKFIGYNFTDQSVQIKKGDRIAQALLIKIEKCEFAETEQTSQTSRGGIGSTG